MLKKEKEKRTNKISYLYHLLTYQKIFVGKLQYWKNFRYQTVYFIVLILDGNSEIGAHVRSNIGYLVFVRHSF